MIVTVYENTYKGDFLCYRNFLNTFFQSMAGMLGISVYILADTYFISVYSGADGLAVLNLILPVYG